MTANRAAATPEPRSGQNPRSQNLTRPKPVQRTGVGTERVVIGRRFARTDQDPKFRENPSRPVTGEA